jgi:hypothetical protein
MNDWTKWMLTTTILSMSLAPATGFAAANPEAATSAPEGITFSDFSAISQDKVQAVQKAVEQGLLNGFPDGRFDPKKSLSRQELAVILSKALHLLPESAAAPSFSDTTQTWASPYIEAVRKAGLMGGDDGNAFRPNDPVTHEELAAVFVRSVRGVGAKGESGSSGTPADGKVSAWAQEAFAVSQRMGLMESDEVALDPRGNVEREDIAAFLIEIFKNEQRTAVINKIDGDFVTIDGQSMLIDGQLKALFAGKNKTALEGAILKYTLLNKNVDGLAELEIVKGGSEDAPVSLDMTGSSFNGVLRIAGDNLAVIGEALAQIEIKQGVKQVELNVNANRVSVLTDEPLQLKGSIEIQTLTVVNEKARVTLDKGVMIDKVELPSSVRASQVISNYEQVKLQIKNREQEQVSTPTPTTTPPTVVNQPPAAASGAITPTAGTVGGSAVTVELNGTFTDEDAASLTYTATSSAAGVATVSVTGTMLSLTPVTAGSATITVTATDNGGLTATRTFDFTVNAAPVVNQPPAAASGAITPAAGTAGGTAVTVELNGTFTDEDTASLTYSATSSAAGVATVSVTGTTLTLTPLSAGNANITVTATDFGGLTATRTFAFTVNAAPVVNQPPTPTLVVINPADGEAGGKDTTVDISGMFQDEETENLTYSAVSSDDMIAVVKAVAGTTITLTPKAIGKAKVTVTATDLEGLSATMDFEYEVVLAEVHAELKRADTVLHAKPAGDITLYPSSGSYSYSKRNLLDLIKLTHKGSELSSITYDSQHNDFDIKDASNNHIGDVKLASSDPTKLGIAQNSANGPVLQPGANITESDNAALKLIISVETVGGGTQVVTLPVQVDTIAPTITNVTANSDNTVFTLTFSEAIIKETDIGQSTTDTIVFSQSGLGTDSITLSLGMGHYTLDLIPQSNQATVTLSDAGKAMLQAVNNGSKFTFTQGSLTDYADNTVSGSYAYTVIIDNGGGIPGG